MILSTMMWNNFFLSYFSYVFQASAWCARRESEQKSTSIFVVVYLNDRGWAETLLAFLLRWLCYSSAVSSLFSLFTSSFFLCLHCGLLCLIALSGILCWCGRMTMEKFSFSYLLLYTISHNKLSIIETFGRPGLDRRCSSVVLSHRKKKTLSHLDH